MTPEVRKNIATIPALEWVIILFVAVLSFLWMSCNEERPLRVLPVYGPVDENTKPNHHISDFSLTNQEGKIVTQKDFDGKIYVADFFFTTCRSICPIMSTQLERVYDKYKTNPDVMFISHSVNPVYDTPQILQEYANKHHADVNKWMFVTGDKKQIYELARDSYLVSATEGDGGDEDFVHTQNFALVDKEKRIRGYYDGTDSTDVNKLMTEMDMLLKEYKYKK